MPRDGSGVYTQPFPDVVAGTTIESAKYNGNVNDVEQDLNTPRPVVAGGTGGTDVNSALDNLSAEKYKQVVTNWDTNVWRAGSFYAATGATGAAPIPGKAFAGIVYYANATDFVIEATNLTDPGGVKYIRKQTAGAWEGWATVDTSKKNYIINGAMMVSQEWGSSGVSGLGLAYPADQFAVLTLGTSGVYGAAQAALVTPSGSPNRFRLALSTADAAVAAGDLVMIYQPLEGLRVADLRSGTASAKTITIQFGVKAPAGTYCLSIRNGAANRSYVAEYVITAGEANTDVIKSITFKLDTSGTWPVDNTLCMTVQWCLMCGTTYQASGANIWWTGNYSGTANQFNFYGNLSNIFELFDVSLTEGTVAPPFVVPDYATELQACRRYFWTGLAYQLRGMVITGIGPAAFAMTPLASFRSSPTLSIVGTITGTTGIVSGSFTSVAVNYSTVDSIFFNPNDPGGFSVAGATLIVNAASTGKLVASARI